MRLWRQLVIIGLVKSIFKSIFEKLVLLVFRFQSVHYTLTCIQAVEKESEVVEKIRVNQLSIASKNRLNVSLKLFNLDFFWSLGMRGLPCNKEVAS